MTPFPFPPVEGVGTVTNREDSARIINRAYRDEMDPGKAGRLGYLVGILLKAIEIHDLEQRIAALESRTGGGR